MATDTTNGTKTAAALPSWRSARRRTTGSPAERLCWLFEQADHVELSQRLPCDIQVGRQAQRFGCGAADLVDGRPAVAATPHCRGRPRAANAPFLFHVVDDELVVELFDLQAARSGRAAMSDASTTALPRLSVRLVSRTGQASRSRRTGRPRDTCRSQTTACAGRTRDAGGPGWAARASETARARSARGASRTADARLGRSGPSGCRSRRSGRWDQPGQAVRVVPPLVPELTSEERSTRRAVCQ